MLWEVPQTLLGPAAELEFCTLYKYEETKAEVKPWKTKLQGGTQSLVLNVYEQPNICVEFFILAYPKQLENDTSLQGQVHGFCYCKLLLSFFIWV